MNETIVHTNATTTNAAGVKILETIEKSTLLSAEVLQKTVAEWEGALRSGRDQHL